MSLIKYGLTRRNADPASISLDAQWDFTGGLQYAQGGLAVPQTGVTESINMDPLRYGGMCRRPAFDVDHDGEFQNRVCSIQYYENEASDVQSVYVGLDDGTVWVYTDTSAIAQVPGLPADPENCWRMMEVGFRLYMFNGQDQSHVISGIGGAVPLEWTAANSEFPIAEYMACHAGFMWAANALDGEGNRHCNRVYRSRGLKNDPDDPDSFPEIDWDIENDYIDIAHGKNGDCITAIISCGERLIVFKKHSVYEITGFAELELAVTEICADHGAVSCDAVVCCDCRVYAFDKRHGLYSIDGDGIRDEMGRIAYLMTSGCLDDRVIDRVTLGCCQDRIMMSVPFIFPAEPDPPDNNTTFVLFPEVGDGAWTIYEVGLGVHAQILPKNGLCRCVVASNQDPNTILRFDQGNPGGGDVFLADEDPRPYRSHVRTSWYDGGSAHLQKFMCPPEILWDTAVDSNADDLKVFIYEDWCGGDPVATFDALAKEDTALPQADFEVTEPGADPIAVGCEGPEQFPCPRPYKRHRECVGSRTSVEPVAVQQLVIQGPEDEYWCLACILIKSIPIATGHTGGR